jgi:hypothetical protein
MVLLILFYYIYIYTSYSNCSWLSLFLILSCWDYILLSDGITDEFKKIWKVVVMDYLLSQICLEEHRKTTKNLSQNTKWSSRDLCQAPTK